jgi:hypothetical protein
MLDLDKKEALETEGIYVYQKDGEGFWEATQVNSNATQFKELSNNGGAGAVGRPSCGAICGLLWGESFDRVSDAIFVQPDYGAAISFDALANGGVHSAMVWSPRTNLWTHHTYDVVTQKWNTQ